MVWSVPIAILSTIIEVTGFEYWAKDAAFCIQLQIYGIYIKYDFHIDCHIVATIQLHIHTLSLGIVLHELPSLLPLVSLSLSHFVHECACVWCVFILSSSIEIVWLDKAQHKYLFDHTVEWFACLYLALEMFENVFQMKSNLCLYVYVLMLLVKLHTSPH